MVHSSAKNIILLLVDTHWGEVDWILPVLHKIREKEEDIKLVAIFSSKKLFDKRKTQLTLYNSLCQYTDDVIYPNPKNIITKTWDSFVNCLPMRAAAYYTDRFFQILLHKPPGTYFTTFLYNTSFAFPKVVNPRDVRIILKDFSNDSRFDRKIEKCCLKAKIVVFPHATSILISQDCNQRNNPEYLRHFHKHDLFLVSTKYSVKWWAEQHCQEDAVPVGFPRLDKWWINEITSDEKIKNTDDYKWVEENKSKNKKVFLYFTRHTSPCMLTLDSFEYLIKSTLEAVMNHEDAVLLIKPHPNQSIPQLLNILKDFDSTRWRIASLQAMLLANISDFVISMHSTCILDSLAVGKPVVEFFQYKDTPEDYPVKNDGYLFCNNGKLGSPQRYLEIVAEADTKDELEFYISDYFSPAEKPKNRIWEEQQLRFKNICGNSDSASDTAADLILNIIKDDIQ